jgi:RNA polymerase sigma-70 factor (ECF subfamily)
MVLCGNATLAEDLAQDTLVEAWKSLRRYNGRCQFFTWLCAILLNRHRNAVRKKRLTPFSAVTNSEHGELQNRAENVADGKSLPDEASQLREQAALVWECIQALPVKHQQVVYLRFYADDSLEGIAAAAGCSVGTVKSRLYHALEKLRGMRAMAGQMQHFKTKDRSL